MRKHLFLAFVLTALFLTGKGQQVYFDSVYQIKENRCSIGWNILAESNFYLIAGITTDSVYNNLRFYLAKLDSNGNRVWEKQYGESLEYFYYTGINSLIKTNDNNYVLSIAEHNRNIDKIRILLAKFNSTGDTLWTKRYSYNNYNEAYHCKQTKDKGFIIIGASDSTDAANHADMTLIKTDSLGNLEWQKFYHKTGTERAMSMDLMDDKGYVIGGWRDNINFTAELIRTDSIGNIKWSNAYGSSYGGYGAAIKKTLNGDYLIGYCTGVSNNGGLDIFYQITLKRLNNNNQTLWTKTYGHLIYNGGSYTILEDENGDITFVGAFADSATQHVLSYIIKTDSSGNQKYMRLYDHLTAVNDQNYLYDIKATNDKGFIATGFCAGSGSPQYCWVVKVDSVGCQFPGCNVMVNELEEPEGKILLYPNPALGELNISVPFEGPFTMEVYSTDGQLLISKSYSPKENVINLQSLKPGLYMLNVKGKTKSTTAKFVRT
jgi:hypothetical protein